MCFGHQTFFLVLALFFLFFPIIISIGSADHLDTGKPDPDQSWEDILRVRAKETVRMRIPFRDFVGKTVYHCHVLDREDFGMMGLVDMQA